MKTRKKSDEWHVAFPTALYRKKVDKDQLLTYIETAPKLVKLIRQHIQFAKQRLKE
jgi:hypothetical protein